MKHIKCKTKEQMKKILGKLEKDGYRWASGTNPTEYVPFDSYEKDTVIEADDEHRNLTFGSYGYFVGVKNVKVFIDGDDFIRSEKKRPSIVIFRRDRNVIAKNVATGDEGIAKCSPNDDFVFKTGAVIAMARLMAKTPEVLTDDVRTEQKKALGIDDIPARADHRFNVGDYVTLKEGLTADKVYGGLELLQGAMYDNAHNQRMTVVRVDWSNNSSTYFYECKGNSQFTYHYSEEMLDKWDDNKIREGDKVRIKKGCTGMRYDLHHDWVKKYISDPDFLLAFEREKYIETSLDYEVVKIAPHGVQSKTLAYIKYEGDFRTLCYLFDIEALEKV